MAHTDQPDQLAARDFEPYGPDPDQLDMFGPPPAGSCGPDPASVRAKLPAACSEVGSEGGQTPGERLCGEPRPGRRGV